MEPIKTSSDSSPGQTCHVSYLSHLTHIILAIRVMPVINVILITHPVLEDTHERVVVGVREREVEISRNLTSTEVRVG